jgi:hypothetical protein
MDGFRHDETPRQDLGLGGACHHPDQRRSPPPSPDLSGSPCIWPKQPVWMRRIASGYEVDIRSHAEGSAARRNAAQRALIWGERHRAAAVREAEAYGRDPEFVRALYAYSLAVSALEAGALERARRFASESLELKDIEARLGMYGGHPPDSDVHAAHIILGLVDLREGNVDGAQEHLRAASRVRTVEPWEATFGPTSDWRVTSCEQVVEKPSSNT